MNTGFCRADSRATSCWLAPVKTSADAACMVGPHPDLCSATCDLKTPNKCITCADATKIADNSGNVGLLCAESSLLSSEHAHSLLQPAIGTRSVCSECSPGCFLLHHPPNFILSASRLLLLLLPSPPVQRASTRWVMRMCLLLRRPWPELQLRAPMPLANVVWHASSQPNLRSLPVHCPYSPYLGNTDLRPASFSSLTLPLQSSGVCYPCKAIEGW